MKSSLGYIALLASVACADAKNNLTEHVNDVDVSVMIRTKLIEALTAQLGRSPTEDELNEMMEQFTNCNSNVLDVSCIHCV